MKVAELIEKLNSLPQDSLVVSSDSEGNSFNLLTAISEGLYNGEDLVDEEDIDGETMISPAVVLWP